jgi:high-affinity iron transporter
MLGALIIVFREVIEAGLIVGIVLAVTQGVHGSRLVIVAGVAAGVVGASLVAAFAGSIANALAGVGQEIFNASILLIAVAMLIWHNIWMAGHGRELAAEVKRVGDAVRTGSRSIVALGVVCTIAVMREGSEVALFMYGLVASGGSTASELIAGAILGLLAGVAVTAVTYFGLATIPPRRLFAVTTLLISFLAAGLAAQAVLFLQQAGAITALNQTAWDTSAVLSDTSLFGRVLHTLIGYSDQPSVLQVVVYVATLAVIVALTKSFAPRRTPARKAVGAAPAE